MAINRRNFVKGAGAFLACAEYLVNPAMLARASQLSATEALGVQSGLFKSTCVHCVNFCGIEVKKKHGVIRSILPDAARGEFYNQGICPKGVSGLFNTYNPYRVKKPLKRTNPKKGLDQEPGWVEISWDEALDTIASKMKKIREDNPAKFIWQHGHGKYLIGDKFPKAFAKAYGTPNLVHRTTSCEAARHVADELTWGYHGFLPDVDNCRLLLNFGANYFEGEQFSRWLDHSITDAKAKGLRVISIEPRLSVAGSKADQWIPVRPGKDVVLLLGLSNWLIHQGHIDETFLVTYTNSPNLVGKDGAFVRDGQGRPLVWDSVSKSAKPYVAGVKPALRGDYEVDGKRCTTAFDIYAKQISTVTPAQVEKIADVPLATFTALAEEIASAAMIGTSTMVAGKSHRYRPVAIHTFRGLSAKQYGTQTWRAGLILQMLLGSVDAVGGINLHSVYKEPKYFDASKAEYPPTRVDLQESIFFPHATHNVCQQVSLTLLDPEKYGLPYKPEMQIFYATNRPFSVSEAHQQFEGMKKTYNVTIDIVLSETAMMSDIVLPDLTYLESWHYSPTRYTPSSKHYAIRQPIVNAYDIPYDAYDILWQLSKRLGIRDEYVEQINKNWKLDKYALQQGRDYSAKETVENIWLESTKGKSFNVAVKHGFIGKHLAPDATYLSGVEAQFNGADKPKMNFYAEQMLQSYQKIRKTVSEKKIRSIDLKEYEVALSPLPMVEHANPTPHREASNYPYYLITYKRMYRNQSANTAMNPIQNALGPDVAENFVLMNADEAGKQKIRDGQLVEIQTRVGKVSGKVKLTQGIRPDTVAVSYHYGQQSTGMPDTARTGIWVNSVLENHPDIVSGMNSFNDTKCSIRALA